MYNKTTTELLPGDVITFMDTKQEVSEVFSSSEHGKRTVVFKSGLRCRRPIPHKWVVDGDDPRGGADEPELEAARRGND